MKAYATTDLFAFNMSQDSLLFWVQQTKIALSLIFFLQRMRLTAKGKSP